MTERQIDVYQAFIDRLRVEIEKEKLRGVLTPYDVGQAMLYWVACFAGMSMPACGGRCETTWKGFLVAEMDAARLAAINTVRRAHGMPEGATRDDFGCTGGACAAAWDKTFDGMPPDTAARIRTLYDDPETDDG